ncbi:MAG: hypothetical protein JRI25_01785 [Deltaproteobacteria bacterium]|nr:hypothetical protein [Deltaproteobacteria bacterium]
MVKGKSTIASLVRAAAKDEGEFKNVVQEILDAADHERTAEFFDRLNIPRSVLSETNDNPLVMLETSDDKVGAWDQERAISNGIQKFMDRHERKLKWHATHPAVAGVENTLLLVRAAMSVTELRLKRLRILLDRQDELTPVQWAIARELMNRSFLAFRNVLHILATTWIEAMQNAIPPEDLAEKLGNFYEFVDNHIRLLEEFREQIEARRTELTVVPEGFPPVKPPNYFGGDLMGRGPWKQFWSTVDQRAHHFREALG